MNKEINLNIVDLDFTVGTVSTTKNAVSDWEVHDIFTPSNITKKN